MTSSKSTINKLNDNKKDIIELKNQLNGIKKPDSYEFWGIEKYKNCAGCMSFLIELEPVFNDQCHACSTLSEIFERHNRINEENRIKSAELKAKINVLRLEALNCFGETVINLFPNRSIFYKCVICDGGAGYHFMLGGNTVSMCHCCETSLDTIREMRAKKSAVRYLTKDLTEVADINNLIFATFLRIC
jgi:hypothetical protein